LLADLVGAKRATRHRCARASRDAAEVLAGQQTLGKRRERYAADALPAEHIEQATLDPAVQHRVRRLGNEQRREGARKYLLASLDQSLGRMGLDYVDIFYSHRFDPETPVEETMGALDTAVRSGRALYAGISSYSAERTAEAAAILRAMGTRPAATLSPTGSPTGGAPAGKEPLVEIGHQVGHVDVADIVGANGWLFGSGAKMHEVDGALRTPALGGSHDDGGRTPVRDWQRPHPGSHGEQLACVGVRYSLCLG
jgi:aryl-alcohol dehydrogenase-like predicted oxidoreductase